MRFLILLVMFISGSAFAVERQSYTSPVVIPTISTSIYASGDQVGPLFTLSTALADPKGHATLKSINVVDLDKQAASLDVIFFNDSPTVASSDNAAIDISDAEMKAKAVGVVNIAAGNYFALANNSVATVKDINLALGGKQGSKALYGIVVSRGTPTYTTTQSLRLTFTFEQH